MDASQVACCYSCVAACLHCLPAMLTRLDSQAGITRLCERYLYCMLAVLAVMMMPGVLLQVTFMLELTTSR